MNDFKCGRLKMKQKKRILMLLENSPFPTDERVRREARSLIENGYKVTLICPASPDQPRRENYQGVLVYRYPRPVGGEGAWGYIWEYTYSMIVILFLSFYVLLREGFDVVHAHQPPDAFAWIAGIYKLLGKKYVMDHHDLAPELYDARFRGEENTLVKRLLILLEKFSCRIADHVIATNQSYKKIEMERDGVPEERITIVRNGPDASEAFVSTADPTIQKNGRTILVYVGVTGVQDGVDYLLRAIHDLVFRLGRKDVLCVIVGSGSALPDLKALSKTLNLNGYVHFTGWVHGQEQVWGYLKFADICVAPEPSDPYNDRSTAAKVMEYMAAGKPIVSFDLPEHRFTAQDAAVYAHPNDEADFAKKVLELIDDVHRQKEIGKKGVERIKKELAWSFQAKKLLSLYESL